MDKTRTGPRGFFGIGIYHTKTWQNVGSLMRSAYCFGASFVYTVGKRYTKDCLDTPNTAKQVPCFHYGDLDDLLRHLPIGCPLVGIEMSERATPLHTFYHLPQACYLLGAEDSGLPPIVLDRCHQTVSVPGTRMCLNVATTGSIVMYDRSMKGR